MNEIDEFDIERILATDEIEADTVEQWFDKVSRHKQKLEDAYAEKVEQRDAATADALAPVDAWFERDAKPIAVKIDMLQAAIKARMLEYRETTGKKSYKGPYSKIASRVADDWQWPKDDTALLLALAAIDRSTFVRDTTRSAIDRENVRSVAVVKDGAAVIDGIELPDLVIEQDKVTVTISPLPVPGGF